jgi:UDP-galactopyranose mutase
MSFGIVGAGLSSAVIARELAEADRDVVVLERRSHIGGNCYTEQIEGIHVHRYGPHIFHTANERVWKFVNRFVEFNHSTERKRLLNAVHVVRKEDNVKQHEYTHKVL